MVACSASATPTFVVTTNNNAGAGSLRQAIADAPTGSTIVFDASLSGQSIFLQDDGIQIEKDLTISAESLPENVIIDGILLPDRQMIRTSNTSTVTFDSLTFTRASAKAPSSQTERYHNVGGALYTTGTTTCRNCFFLQNCAINGGAIFSDFTYANLTIIDCVFVGNSANQGGAIASGGELRCTGSLFIGNSATAPNSGTGGAVSSEQFAFFRCESSTFRDNEAAGNGGGIWNGYRSTLICTDCSFENNISGDAGGGISSGYQFSGHNLTFAGNQGKYGGALSVSYNNPTMNSCTNSTFSNNTGELGGAIFCRDNLRLSSSTISGNSANQGGGIYSGTGGQLTLNNSIVAANEAIQAGPDLYTSTNPITTSGPNLIGINDGSGLPAASSLVGTAAFPVNPRLAPLAIYHGNRATMPPLSGSPAIEAGDNATLPADLEDLDGDLDTTESLPVDQTGNSRIVGTNVDLGAVEARPFSTLPHQDVDTDGINDLAELGFFGDLDTAHASTDKDGDGFLDGEEVLSMTDPCDPSDFLRIQSIAPSPTFDSIFNPVITLRLPTYPGLSYQIERSSTLQGSFVPLGASFAASNFSTEIELTLQPGEDFIRVVRE